MQSPRPDRSTSVRMSSSEQDGILPADKRRSERISSERSTGRPLESSGRSEANTAARPHRASSRDKLMMSSAQCRPSVGVLEYRSRATVQGKFGGEEA
jgi:hypothetical protein